MPHGEGAIKPLENSGVQKDNVNKTITVYVEMDALEQNTTQWIEWRDIPSEGWKINSVSFDGNIDTLAAPLSPKKNTKFYNGIRYSLQNKHSLNQ